MSFRHRLKYFLVKKLRISNKTANDLIQNGKVLVNKKVVFENVEVNETCAIEYQNQTLQIAKKYHYFAFYKPIGIESTLDTNNPDSLLPFLPAIEGIFPVGRLDKASEGLMLLTNNGKIFDKTLRKEHAIEKEYWVKVNRIINPNFLDQMANGIVIMGQKTLPCEVQQLDDFTFSIVLIQGLNRQIRRMCYKMGYEVTILKRVRIGKLKLGNLIPGEIKACDFEI